MSPLWVFREGEISTLDFEAGRRTNQFFHASIRSQPDANLRSDLRAYRESDLFDPKLFVELSPLEGQIKSSWPAPTLSKKEKKKRAKVFSTDDFELGEPRPDTPSSVGSFTDKEDDDSDRPSSVTSFTDNESDPERPPKAANVQPAGRTGSAVVPAATTAAVLDPLSTRTPSRTHNGAFSRVRRVFGREEKKVLSTMKDRNR